MFSNKFTTKKNLNLRFMTLIVCFFLTSSTWAQSQETFSEKWLIENINKNGLAPLSAEQMDLSGEEIALSSQVPYSYQMGGSGQIFRSNSDASNSFQPAVRNSHGWDVYASKAWTIGMTSKLGIKNDYSKLKSSSGDILSHSPTYYLQIQASLFQNLFGKLDRALQEQSQFAKTTYKLKAQMAEHQSITAARTLYWSIMANNISISLSKSLIETSKQQLKEMNRRYKSGAAEKADVYLSEAQVSQREAALLGLQLKEQGYLRELRLIVPAIGNIGRENFPTINIENVIANVSECIVQISSHKETPRQYTSYAALFEIYKKISAAESSLARKGLGPEVSLGLQVASKGVDPTFNDAFSEASDLNKGSWGASLGVTVPLDGSSSKLIRTKKRLAEINELKQHRELELLLNGTHESALTSIQYLLGSIRTLDSSSKALGNRVEAVQKKYRQGRVDFLSLVQEQDQLFNADIGLTESRLLFLRELFNYFSIFNKTPCDFNLEYAKIAI